MLLYESMALALWLGILTSISPCPLTANIVTVSFLSKNISKSKSVFFSGFLYILGRTVSYILIAFIIIYSLVSIPGISYFFQNYFNKIIGPLLIITGMILLNLITLKLPGIKKNDKFKQLAEKNNYWGAYLMGMVFALSFCPVSAALFFGSLIPLSLKNQSVILLPALYGIGTALPVLCFVFLIAAGSKIIGNVFNKITVIELWIRRITGVIFIVAGIIYTINFIFCV